jgi:hypothetical protein
LYVELERLDRLLRDIMQDCMSAVRRLKQRGDSEEFSAWSYADRDGAIAMYV